jgi:SAM-dependent methyltransferase
MTPMYERLKRLLPRRFLIAYEPMIRRVLAWFYRGRKHRCNICEAGLRRFIRRPDDLMCPRCGSLSRNRRLFAILVAEFLRPGVAVLDFSPSRSLFRRLKAEPMIRYTASDFASEFIADEHYDLTLLPVPDRSYDVIVCYHVLEHIEDDAAAIAGLHRALKPGGTALIQTPFKDGDIDEDPAVTSPAERRRRFGQEDHVRNYSVAGLVGRVEGQGFTVDTRQFREDPDNINGFAVRETVLIATKPATNQQEAPLASR